MLEQKTGARMTKSANFLFSMILVRLFLTQLIFFQILFHTLTLFLQTNLNYFNHPCNQTATMKLLLEN